MIEILTAWLNHLKNADHVGITTQIYTVAKEAEINNDMYKAATDALAKAIADEDEAYKKTQKDWVVEDLKAADLCQDAYMICLRHILTGHAALPKGEPTKQKAKELLQLWKDFNFRTADSYSGESAKVISMYQEVAKRQADAEELGVWTLFGKARQSAEKVQQLLSDRFTDLASRNVGEMRRARLATDQTIKQLYTMINSLQGLAPTTAVTELAKKLRAIEDYARAYYLNAGHSRRQDDQDGQ